MGDGNSEGASTESTSTNKYMIPIVMGVLTIILYSTSLGLTVRSLGNADKWKNIKENITNPIIITAIAGLVLYITLAIYCIQSANKYTNYIILAIACAGLFCSYFAIGLAVIVKR